MFNYLVNQIMLPFLTFSYDNIYPNYGLAIIILTLFVKVVFYPLTKKQMLAMKLNLKFQPKIKEIQEKFKGQPEKLQKEMMNIFKENKMNPLSGCLPLLIQLPIFIAIFVTVNSPGFKALIMQPGINPGLFPFWLSNLGAKDGTLILPLLLGISTYFSQKTMNMDPKQASLFVFMPFLMFFISMSMPSGVLLYWVVSTVISIVQQVMINNKFDADEKIITVKAKIK